MSTVDINREKGKDEKGKEKGKEVFKSYGCLLRNIPEVEKQSKDFVVGATPAHVLEKVKLPKNFDGRKVWKKFLTPIKDQGKCGCCYSAASVSSLGDRFSILTLGKIKYELSISDMVMCMTINSEGRFSVTDATYIKSNETFRQHQEETRKKYGCLGNTLYNAATYLFVIGAPPENCIPDSLVRSHYNNIELPFCEEIEGEFFDTCLDKKTAQRYFRATKVYQLPYDKDNLEDTEKQIMMDIYKWGPLSAGFIMTEDFIENYDGLGIYTTKFYPEDNSTLMGHAVKIVGWGEEDVGDRIVKYWICANSWGTEWGDEGYFKVERFLPGIELEKNTISLIPDLPGVVQFEQNYDKNSMITDADREARRLVGVSLYTYYPSVAVDKIKERLLVGDLINPLIDPDNLPANYIEFYAGKANTYNLKDLIKGARGKNISPLWIIFIMLIGAVIGIAICYKLLKKCKGMDINER